LPHLQALYEKYRGLGLEMVAIQVHPEENRLVPAWRAKGKYTFPVVFVPPARSDGSDTFAASRFDVLGVPTALLLNAERKIVFRHLGGGRVFVEAEIRELLGLPPFEE